MLAELREHCAVSLLSDFTDETDAPDFRFRFDGEDVRLELKEKLSVLSDEFAWSLAGGATQRAGRRGRDVLSAAHLGRRGGLSPGAGCAGRALVHLRAMGAVSWAPPALRALG